jgi:hypothetical protein
VGALAAHLERDDRVGVAVYDQRRHVNLARSSRKSVYENAAMQSSVPFGEAKDAISRW